MGKKIFKYTLPRNGESIIINTHIVRWLSIQSQNGQPCIWTIVDDDFDGPAWTITSWGTGWEVPEELVNCAYLGTCQDEAEYVWHYFGKTAASTTEYEYKTNEYILTAGNCPTIIDDFVSYLSEGNRNTTTIKIHT